MRNASIAFTLMTMLAGCSEPTTSTPTLPQSGETSQVPISLLFSVTPDGRYTVAVPLSVSGNRFGPSSLTTGPGSMQIDGVDLIQPDGTYVVKNVGSHYEIIQIISAGR